MCCHFFVCLFVYLPEKAICMLTPFHCNGSSGQYAEISSMSIMPIMIEYYNNIYIYVATRLLKDRLCIIMTFMHSDGWVNYYEKCSRH